MAAPGPRQPQAFPPSFNAACQNCAPAARRVPATGGRLFLVGGSWRAIAAFEQPPSPITLLAWSLIALLGLLSLAVLALVDEHRSTRG